MCFINKAMYDIPTQKYFNSLHLARLPLPHMHLQGCNGLRATPEYIYVTTVPNDGQQWVNVTYVSHHSSNHHYPSFNTDAHATTQTPSFTCFHLTCVFKMIRVDLSPSKFNLNHTVGLGFSTDPIFGFDGMAVMGNDNSIVYGFQSHGESGPLYTIYAMGNWTNS